MFVETENVNLTATVADRNDDRFWFLIKSEGKLTGNEMFVFLTKDATRLLYEELRSYFEDEFKLKSLKPRSQRTIYKDKSDELEECKK